MRNLTERSEYLYLDESKQTPKTITEGMKTTSASPDLHEYDNQVLFYDRTNQVTYFSLLSIF